MNNKITRRAFAKAGIPLAAAGLLVRPDSLIQSVSAQDATPVAEAGPVIPPEIADHPNDWPVWHGDLFANRAAKNSAITIENVGDLEVAWRFPITAAGYYGSIVAPVLIIGDVVYAQDSVSNVYAIDRATGEQIWISEIDAPNVGPNGLAAGYGKLFGTTGLGGEVYALDIETGEEVWRRKLTGIASENLFGAPGLRDNTVYVGSAGGYSGKGRSALYALDVSTGDLRWEFDTVADNAWNNPANNSGAAIWYQPSFDDAGNVYIGTGNPAQFTGTPDAPNAADRPGDNLYSSSMVSLEAATGAIRWYYQDRPHDLVDHDFQNTPLIAHLDIDGETREFAIGSGKTGNIAAVETATGQLIWKIPVGTHNGYGDGIDLPADGTPVATLPGLYGGVETGLALSGNTLYAGIVQMPSTFSATTQLNEGNSDYDAATGLLISIDAPTGQINWQVDLPQLPFAAATIANDVVFVPLMNGTFNAFSTVDGSQLFTYQAGAGFAAPPSVAGDLVIGAAGGFLFGDYPEDLEKKSELIAFRVPGSAATPTS